MSLHKAICQKCKREFDTISYVVKWCEKCKVIRYQERAKDYRRRKLKGQVKPNPCTKYRVINEEFFDTWSPEMAWVLGFFFADGNLSQVNNKLRIEFSSKDRDVLEQVRTLLQTDYKIGCRSKIMNGKKLVWHQLVIPNQKIAKRVLELGGIERKSLVLVFPNVPDKYVSHLVRGFFDGDGSIWINNVEGIWSERLNLRFDSASKIAVEWLYDQVKSFANIERRISNDHGTFYFALSTGQALRICEWMYKDTTETSRLKRKFDIYSDFVSRLTEARKHYTYRSQRAD